MRRPHRRDARPRAHARRRARAEQLGRPARRASAALRRPRRTSSRQPGRPDAIMAMIDTLFPRIDPTERHTIERFVVPRLATRLRTMAAGSDAPTPYDNGGPGFANPAASLKYQLGLMPDVRGVNANGYESTPDFGFRHLRAAIYSDGGYGVLGKKPESEMTAADATDAHLAALGQVTSVFTVAVMGVPLNDAPSNSAAVAEMFHFIREYRPPPFPGRIDSALASRGGDVYVRRCASCHGE